MDDYISRADAINAVAEEWLSEASAESPYVNDDDIGEYRKLAEKLFEDVPSAELTLQTPQTYGKSINPSNAEVVEDLISRADAIADLEELAERYNGTVTADGVDLAIDRIKALPSADCIEFDFNKYQPRVRNKVNDGKPSADAVDCTDFINWLLEEVMDEENWHWNAEAYGEIICRKLVKLGVLEVTEEPSYYIRPSADAVSIVYCMDCAKSVPLDEHGALWKCKAHDRTTLRHSYCNNGERKGGDRE